jgi:hypothetical protein
MSLMGQNEPCHSLRRHGRSTSLSSPAQSAVVAAALGQKQTNAGQHKPTT